MNPKSGGGKAERFHLTDKCAARGIEPIVLQPGDDPLHLAKDAIVRGKDVIGMASGDGSQALVATVAAEPDIPHVCIPAGTPNHFARDWASTETTLSAPWTPSSTGWNAASIWPRSTGGCSSTTPRWPYAKIVQSEAYRDAKLKTASTYCPICSDPTPSRSTCASAARLPARREQIELGSGSVPCPKWTMN